MTDLLEHVLAAHGGLERWQQVTCVSARVRVSGAIWALKGWPDAFAEARFTIDPRRQQTQVTRAAAPDQRYIFEPDLTAIADAHGNVIERRERPRESFAGHALATRWDAHHLLYFAGYAMWTYLTTPFLLRMPGFRSEEIDSWEEEGETWRRLKVTFPAHIHGHSTEQVFYFDASGLLRRHDYSVDVMGGTSSGHYASEPRVFGGLVFPTRRRVYSLGPDRRPLRERLAVAIDVDDIEVSTR